MKSNQNRDPDPFLHYLVIYIFYNLPPSRHTRLCLDPDCSNVQIKLPLSMVDLAQTITEWKDVEGNKVTVKLIKDNKVIYFLADKDDDQYLGDICFSLRYVPTSGKVKLYSISGPHSTATQN